MAEGVGAGGLLAACLVGVAPPAGAQVASGASSGTVRVLSQAIDEDMGLADIVVRAPAAIERARLTLRSGSVPLATFELERADGEADGPSRVWRGRVMAWPDGTGANEGALTCGVALESDSGLVKTVGPVPVETVRGPDGVPSWALGATWYQIMPERFRNGNPANDPIGPDVHRMRWNAPWEPVSTDEFEAAAARAAGGLAEHGRSSPLRFADVLVARRYGGDLQGVVQQLDDLRDLGINAIYLTPIFDAPSLHKYDARDFRHVDPTLGGSGERSSDADNASASPTEWAWTEADRYFVDTLLPAARERGMRVIIDGAWYHTGREFWAFRDVRSRGRASPFVDWCRARFTADGRLAGWSAWDGENGRLPHFRQTPEGDLVSPVKQHVFDITARWMDPDGDGDPRDGVAGWRLDVADRIGAAFWRDWRRHVRAINPDACLIGELWFHAPDRLGEAGFDGQMNYPLARALTDWLRGAASSREFGDVLKALRSVPPANVLAQMNLLSSHDTQRFVSALANPAAPFDSGGDLRSSAAYDRARPGPQAYELAVLGLAFVATYPGSPMVFCGEEWGVHGGKDPDCRKPVPWPDQAAAEGDPARQEPMTEVRAAFRNWLLLRQDAKLGPILRYGDVQWVETGADRVAAFARSLNGQRALVVLNAGDEPFDAGHFADVAGFATLAEISVKPRSGLVLTSWGTLTPPSP